MDNATTETTGTIGHVVPLRALHALALLAGDNTYPARYQGVWVDPQTRPGSLALFATNSAMAGVLRVGKPGGDVHPWFVPARVIKQLPKQGLAVARRDTSGDAPKGRICVPETGLQLEWQVTGEMPKWENALPKAVSGEACFFDALQMALFAKVNAALGAPKDRAGLIDVKWDGGAQACIVRFKQHPDFVGLCGVFPERTAHDYQTQSLLPDWLSPAPGETLAGAPV